MSDTQDSDKERFEHAGLECKILRTDLGHWCGYVRAPDDLPPTRWQSNYDEKLGLLDPDVDVWGGVTYGPDDEGWVGFDDAHARSLVDHSDEETDRDAVREETKKLAEQIRSLHTASDRDGGPR